MTLTVASGRALLRPGGYGFYPGATTALDFVEGFYRSAGVQTSIFRNVPGLTVTRATPATTYAETTAGVPVPFAANTARITDKGLLVEEARTNKCFQSQTLATSPWAGTRASISADAVAAPDGTTTADKIVEDATASSTHYDGQTVTHTAAATLTVSVYLKAAERLRLRISFGSSGGTDGFRANFTLSGSGTAANGTNFGTGTYASSSITAMGDGWYRCVVTGTVAAAATTSLLQLLLVDGTGAVSYSGDGASGLYAWGVQVEEGAFVTSYIPTTSASVTRAADGIIVAPGLTGLNTSGYTVYAEGVWRSVSGGANSFIAEGATAGGASVKGATLGANGNNPPDGIRMLARGGASRADFVNGSPVPTSGAVVKMAISGGTSTGNAVNGTTLTAGSAPSQSDWTDGLSIGSRGTASNFWNSYIRKLVIYPYAMSDAQLQALTA